MGNAGYHLQADAFSARRYFRIRPRRGRKIKVDKLSITMKAVLKNRTRRSTAMLKNTRITSLFISSTIIYLFLNQIMTSWKEYLRKSLGATMIIRTPTAIHHLDCLSGRSPSSTTKAQWQHFRHSSMTALSIKGR